METKRNVMLYIAMSLDGYIAKPNDDLSFLSIVEHSDEDYGYSDFIREVDTILLGRKTYDWVMTQVAEFPNANIETYVITRTPRASTGQVNFYSGDLRELVSTLKNRNGKNIFIDGGAEIVNELLKAKLIDAFYISIIPILLGEGIRLFKDGRPEQKLVLVKEKQFDSGLAQLVYKIASD
ncbi:MAG: dihydrofolate reductase family protein [Bacteroidota bacterium]|nr:dihydrofolate reductase family protein [Bacteroidota bacterium]